MDDYEDGDNLELMGPSDALELVFELAQEHVRRQRRKVTERESEWLSVKAAMEQLDNLLMNHWETLDALPRAHPAGSMPARRYVWRLQGGVPVEQSPSEAVLLVVALAEQALPEQPRKRQSATDALSWVRQFISRHGATLDYQLGSQ